MLTDCLTKTKLSLNGVNYKCLVPFVTTSEGVLAGSISVFFLQFLQSKRTTGISGMCLICLLPSQRCQSTVGTSESLTL